MHSVCFNFCLFLSLRAESIKQTVAQESPSQNPRASSGGVSSVTSGLEDLSLSPSFGGPGGASPGSWSVDDKRPRLMAMELEVLK